MFYRFVVLSWFTYVVSVTSNVAEGAVTLASLDDFSVGSQSVVIAAGATGVETDTSAKSTAIFGGARTVTLSLTTADPIRTSSIDVLPSSESAQVSFAGSAIGDVLFSYSSSGGDLLADGANSLVILATISTSSMLSISVVDTSSNVATESFSSTLTGAQEIVLPFADFSNAGMLAFDSVQMLEVRFASAGGMAIGLQEIAIGTPVPVPEPNIGGLLAAVLAVSFLRRSRK